MTLYGLVVRLVDYILHLITDVKTLTKIKIRCIKMNHCSVTGWRSYKVQRKVVFYSTINKIDLENMVFFSINRAAFLLDDNIKNIS